MAYEIIDARQDIVQKITKSVSPFTTARSQSFVLWLIKNPAPLNLRDARRRRYDCLSMQLDIDRVLISTDQIAQRVREMAQQIMADHLASTAPDTEITIVPILTGALVFCADLIRQLSIKMRIGLLTVSSYPGASIRTQGSQVVGQQLGDISGRHVLLVDDILDSGGTVRLVVPLLRELRAARVKVCVLLRKDRPSALTTPAVTVL